VAVILAIGKDAGYTAVSARWLPIIQMRGTKTKFASTPPAHRIIELRRPITYPRPRMNPMASKLVTIFARSAACRMKGTN